MKDRTPLAYITCDISRIIPSMPCYILTLHAPATKAGVLSHWREFYQSSYDGFPHALQRLRVAIGNLSHQSIFAVRVMSVPIFQDGLLLTSINEASHEPGQSV